MAAYGDAIIQAELVLNSGRVDESLVLELNTFVARAAFLDLNRDLAAEKYRYVDNASQGELKAEAMYHLAYLAFYEGDYELSKQIVFEQSRLLPLYKSGWANLLSYWLKIIGKKKMFFRPHIP